MLYKNKKLSLIPRTQVLIKKKKINPAPIESSCNSKAKLAERGGSLELTDHPAYLLEKFQTIERLRLRRVMVNIYPRLPSHLCICLYALIHMCGRTQELTHMRERNKLAL